MRSNWGAPFRLSGIRRKLRAPSTRVISSGYKLGCRLVLKPPKITLMIDKKVMNFFKFQRSLAGTNGSCNFSEFNTQSIEYV
jgi:hypothetical protein